MTLQEYQLQRRDFNFRSRKSFTQYTPSQWDKKRQELEEESEHDEEVLGICPRGNNKLVY